MVVAKQLDLLQRGLQHVMVAQDGVLSSGGFAVLSPLHSLNHILGELMLVTGVGGNVVAHKTVHASVMSLVGGFGNLAEAVRTDVIFVQLLEISEAMGGDDVLKGVLVPGGVLKVSANRRSQLNWCLATPLFYDLSI